MKTYILFWFCNGQYQEVMKGSPALCQWQKKKLKDEPRYKKGRFVILSENGFKYNYQKTVTKTPNP